MVRLNRIYTKAGDGGQTRLVGGQKVAKYAPRIECYGTVDELMACLGLVRTALEQPGAPAGAAELPVRGRTFGTMEGVACARSETSGSGEGAAGGGAASGPGPGRESGSAGASGVSAAFTAGESVCMVP